MSVLKEALEAGKFGITAEMAPPKGCDFTEQMEAAELLAGKVHVVNVTDMTGAKFAYQVSRIDRAGDADTRWLSHGDFDLTLYCRDTYSMEYIAVRCMIAGR